MASPGWYRDPYTGGDAMLRWFDGEQWTADVQRAAMEGVRPATATPPLAPPFGEAAPPGVDVSRSAASTSVGGRASAPSWLRPIVVVPAAVLLGLVGLMIVAAALGSSYRPGEVYSMDQLVAFCSDGHMRACERAFWDSPIGSHAELVGATCGGRLSIGLGPGYDLQIGDSNGPHGECVAFFGERYGFWDRFRH